MPTVDDFRFSSIREVQRQMTLRPFHGLERVSGFSKRRRHALLGVYSQQGRTERCIRPLSAFNMLRIISQKQLSDYTTV